MREGNCGKTPLSAFLGILKEALRNLRAGNVPDLGPQADISHCGCVLGEGCWGSGGWHFARHGIESMVRLEKIRFAAGKETWSKPELRRGWAGWLMEEEDAGRFDGEGVHVSWQPYMGQPYAFESCPAYMRSFTANHGAEQAAKASAGRRRYDMFDARSTGEPPI